MDGKVKFDFPLSCLAVRLSATPVAAGDAGKRSIRQGVMPMRWVRRAYFIIAKAVSAAYTTIGAG
jgi:hypothetical protein